MLYHQVLSYQEKFGGPLTNLGQFATDALTVSVSEVKVLIQDMTMEQTETMVTT